MATAELLRPGVQVLQTIRSTSPTVARPTLVPCIVGPAFEVLDVLNSDGTINSKAKYGAYVQLGKSIAESSFPDPRENIDELDILEESIRAYMLYGGILTNLPVSDGHGSAFLATAHKAGRAAMQTQVFSGATGIALNGKVLVLAFDVASRLDVTKDITVVFAGTGNLTSAQAAAQINAAVGAEVATVTGSAPNDRVQITSTKWGAASSVTVRAGGSANALLQVGYKAADAANPGSHEDRVVGYGFRGQDDNDNDTLTPWVEFFRGEFYQDGLGSSDAGGPAFPATMGFVDLVTSAFATGRQAAMTFTGGGATIPLRVGDYMIADGERVKGGELMKVESGRFKIGTINTALSTADADGNYVSKAYDLQELGTPFDGAVFSPKYVYFVANSLSWRTAAATAAAVTGSVVTPTAATAAALQGSVLAATTLAVAGLSLHYAVTIDGVETEGTFVFTGGPFVDNTPTTTAIQGVAAAIGSNIPGIIATNSTPGVAGGKLTLTTAKTGRLQSITIKSDGSANATLGFSTSADSTVTGTDITYAGLTGKVLKFTLDKNPHIYEVTATTDSLDEMVGEINTIVGYPVASKSGNFLRITSPLKGAASEVVVAVQVPTGAETVLGLPSTVAAGTGRPFPDAYLDDSLILHIGSQLLRDTVKGLPLDQTFDQGSLYVQYRALRKDVSASALEPGVLRISSTDALTDVLSPVNEQNPLALGIYLAMLNAPNFEVKALGIDEVTAAAPSGTGIAWARAAEMLETEEVYAIAPLTQDDTVHGMWRTHASVMSSPENGGERIVFNNKKTPTTKNPKVAVSGSAANSTAQQNQLVLDTNPASGLVTAGVNPGLPFSVTDGVYVEVTVAGEVRRYNVSSVTGSLVNLRTTFTSGQNTDAFYSDVLLNVPVVNSSYSVKVRGASLVVPGSNPARYDYSLMAETVAEANALLSNRRDFEVFPETVTMDVNGVEKSLPGYYASAAIAGMVASKPPQQGFTNYPIVGLKTAPGIEKFTKQQLDGMAGGGTYILMQEVPGGAVFCRHQVSTDISSVETRELSITKVVDFSAKILRQGVRRFIGTNNVSPSVLDMLGATVQAILEFLKEAGVLNGANINNIVQDENAPDTVLIDVTLDVPYPCNYIRLTLVV